MKFILDNWHLLALALASGGMLLWPLLRQASSNGLDTSAAVQLINHEKAVLIDICEPAEFAAGHAIGARNVPLGVLAEKLPGTVKNKALPLILMCQTGARAKRALAQVRQLGYERAVVLGGGLTAWRSANLPTEKA